MKQLINKYFVGIVLIITGAVVFAWNYILATHPYMTVFVLLMIVGIIKAVKKIKRN